MIIEPSVIGLSGKFKLSENIAAPVITFKKTQGTPGSLSDTKSNIAHIRNRMFGTQLGGEPPIIKHQKRF